MNGNQPAAQGLEDVVAGRIRALFGAHARLVSLTPLAGDASSRRYYRAVLSGLSAPRSLVVMELPAESSLPLSSEELAIFATPPKELPFLNLHRFLSRVGVRVPELYGQWLDDGILILEDVGGASLWDRVQGLADREVLTWYKKAVDQLLLIQVAGTRARDANCIAFQQRFDFRLYMWEFDHFIEYGLEKRSATRIGKSATEELKRSFAEIASRLERHPACLNHRDYHSWNLMIHEGKVVVIDFQDALLAPPQYDLASLLNDRVTDEVIGPELEQRLIRYYCDRKEAMGEPRSDRDEFFELYLLSAVQRDFKVVGRFHYLDLVKGKPGYKKFIAPTARRLKRNLARLPQLSRLIPLLAEHYEEMR